MDQDSLEMFKELADLIAILGERVSELEARLDQLENQSMPLPGGPVPRVQMIARRDRTTDTDAKVDGELPYQEKQYEVYDPKVEKSRTSWYEPSLQERGIPVEYKDYRGRRTTSTGPRA